MSVQKNLPMQITDSMRPWGLEIPLILEQPEFEMCKEHLYMNFPPVNTCTVLICSWESGDGEGQVYASIYAIYIEDLNILRFWYSTKSWNQSTEDNQGTTKFWGSQKLDTNFFSTTQGVGNPDPYIV